MEERIIKLSLEKAKEWYKQGGELKEVALQAFKEKELTDVNFPTSWKEYYKNARCKDNRVNAEAIDASAGYCHFTTKEEAEAFVALGKLIQLRDKYWELDNNWKPNWEDCSAKHIICYYYNELKMDYFLYVNQILAFSTKDLRDKFYKNFSDLIEKAKMFL